MEYISDDGAAIYLDDEPLVRLNCCTDPGTGEPLCPPPACNAESLPVPLLECRFVTRKCMHYSAKKRHETTDWLSTTDDTEGRVNDSAKSIFQHFCEVKSTGKKT